MTIMIFSLTEIVVCSEDRINCHHQRDVLLRHVRRVSVYRGITYNFCLCSITILYFIHAIWLMQSP